MLKIVTFWSITPINVVIEVAKHFSLMEINFY